MAKSSTQHSHRTRLSSEHSSLLILAAALALSTFLTFKVFSLNDSREPKLQFSYVDSGIVNRWSSDMDCFVQCFTRLNQSHYAFACGGYGSSKIIVATGFDTYNITANVVFNDPGNRFFEGCASTESRNLTILTWREGVVLEVDLWQGHIIREEIYPREGWGLAYDSADRVLWASDGSDRLYRLDPSSLSTIGECSVRLSHDGFHEQSVRYINELEVHNGTIFANVYMDSSSFEESPNFILAIDPITCLVERVIPIFGLEPSRKSSHVFNGIAVGDNGNLLVTGKNWKHVYEISLGGNLHANHSKLWSRYNISRFLELNYQFR
jgi:glutamine cyclotransferase